MQNQNFDERPTRKFPLFSAVIALVGLALAIFFFSNSSDEATENEVDNLTENQIVLDAFTEIVVSGYYNIDLVESGDFFIEVKGTDMEKEAVDYKVRGGTLYITDRDHTAADIDIIIGCQEIESFEKTGMGAVEIADGVLADEASIDNDGLGEIVIRGGSKKMALTNSGSGSIEVRGLNAKSVTITQEGVGKIELRGKTKSLEIENSGTGEVNAQSLKSEIVEVNNAGIGNVYVNASDSMNLTNQGLGTIYYKGDAIIVQKNQGIGKIIPQVEED